MYPWRVTPSQGLRTQVNGPQSAIFTPPPSTVYHLPSTACHRSSVLAPHSAIPGRGSAPLERHLGAPGPPGSNMQVCSYRLRSFAHARQAHMPVGACALIEALSVVLYGKHDSALPRPLKCNSCRG